MRRRREETVEVEEEEEEGAVEETDSGSKRFYGCYLLVSLSPRHKGRTYIGCVPLLLSSSSSLSSPSFDWSDEALISHVINHWFLDGAGSPWTRGAAYASTTGNWGQELGGLRTSAPGRWSCASTASPLMYPLCRLMIQSLEIAYLLFCYLIKLSWNCRIHRFHGYFSINIGDGKSFTVWVGMATPERIPSCEGGSCKL